MKTLTFSVLVDNSQALQHELTMLGQLRVYVSPSLIVVRADEAISDAKIKEIVQKYSRVPPRSKEQET